MSGGRFRVQSVADGGGGGAGSVGALDSVSDSNLAVNSATKKESEFFVWKTRKCSTKNYKKKFRPVSKKKLK